MEILESFKLCSSYFQKKIRLTCGVVPVIDISLLELFFFNLFFSLLAFDI
jgi:hypothetical protein